MEQVTDILNNNILINLYYIFIIIKIITLIEDILKEGFLMVSCKGPSPYKNVCRKTRENIFSISVFRTDAAHSQKPQTLIEKIFKNL